MDTDTETRLDRLETDQRAFELFASTFILAASRHMDGLGAAMLEAAETQAKFAKPRESAAIVDRLTVWIDWLARGLRTPPPT